MSIENLFNQSQQLPDKARKSRVPFKRLPDIDLAKKQQTSRLRDLAKINKMLVSIGIEKPTHTVTVKKYLEQYLGLPAGAIEQIKLLSAKNLPGAYQSQREFLHDERLDSVSIAVIPDNLWVKGLQPSESSAENNLVSFKKSYFENQKTPDEAAWLTHELAHCQSFLDSTTPEEYHANMQKPAFPDIATEYNYPNNPVELTTFTKQFKYLKAHGKSRANILAMLSEQYSKEDMPFFERVLDGV